MAACCAPFERLADQHFNRKKAAAELKHYREKGPGPTTCLLEEAIVQAGAVEGTLLDIGSGIGSLTFALLNRGLGPAIGVDASSAYTDAASEEARRCGHANRVEFRHADFVTVAPELPTAAVVTLDRVVCCYPMYEALLDAALQRVERCFAFSYPRDVWYVRSVMWLENAQRRLSRNPFRTFVHRSASMEQLIARAGLRRVSRHETWVWSVDVYERR
jgi:tRNA1(Val) A37 N6-methylase TrmN6